MPLFTSPEKATLPRKQKQATSAPKQKISGRVVSNVVEHDAPDASYDAVQVSSFIDEHKL